jgi:DNA (cytosine-5)-methyltransferase 1
MLNEEEITYLELFAGIGGFRLGLERASSNWKTIQKSRQSNIQSKRNSTNGGSKYSKARYICAWSNEINKYASKIYRKNFGTKELVQEDIRKIKTKDIPKADMLVGGFPCQSFSLAGKRKGFNDVRGTLFYEIARIAKAKKPKILLLENVKGLLSVQNGYCFYRIISILDELGYDLEWQVLNSKYFGVPQNRERVFIIGHLRGTCKSQIFLKHDPKQIANDRGCETKWQITPTISTKQDRGSPQLIEEVTPIITPQRMNKRQHGRRMKKNSLDFYTLTSSDKHGIVLGTKHPKIRFLTPLECERLQAFPDNWTKGLTDIQRYKCLGNAVTVNVIEFLGYQIAQNILTN